MFSSDGQSVPHFSFQQRLSQTITFPNLELQRAFQTLEANFFVPTHSKTES